MKKIFYVIAIACVAVLAVNSCKKGDPQDSGSKKRLAMCGDEWDKYHFFYNADGSIKEVKRNYDEETQKWEKTWVFTWNGNSGQAKYIEGEIQQGVLEFGLNGQGYIQKYVDVWGDEYKCTYDLEGHLLKIFRVKDSQDILKSTLVWEGGNLIKWSRILEGGEEQFKNQSFLEVKNEGGICPDFPDSDKAGIDRWLYEAGLMGKPSKLLMDQAAWTGSEAIAVHTYTKDSDGFVTKVSKVYGTDDPELYYYQWELK